MACKCDNKRKTLEPRKDVSVSVNSVNPFSPKEAFKESPESIPSIIDTPETKPMPEVPDESPRA